jgi:hypothetical protein
MRLNLGDSTQISAWDHIMVGAFIRVFSENPELSQKKQFKKLKKLNFFEITEVL